MPRLTARGFGVLALVIGTYLSARVLGTWELYLLCFAFLAALVVSWLLVLGSGRRLSVLESEPRAADGWRGTRIRFQVKNASVFPGPQLTLRSSLEGFSAEDLDFEVESLGPRASRVVKASAGKAERGVHVLPAIRVLAEDSPWTRKHRAKVGDPLTVTVYPRFAAL